MPTTSISGRIGQRLRRASAEVVHRVHDGPVYPGLEVEVRPEAQPGAAGEADHLSLAHALPDADLDARLVAVARRQRPGVLDARVVAVAARRPRDAHRAARRGADRRPARDPDVD